MSSKSTIFLTKDNEHCYHELHDGTIVLEFSKLNINIIINDNEDLIIEFINPNSEIYNLISKIKK